MKKDKTVLGVTLSKLIEFLIFLVILWFLNRVWFNTEIVNFLNQNIELVIIFSIFFYLGELFYIFIFPLNIPYPIFNAIGGILLVKFLFQIFNLIGNYGLRYIEPYITILVFVITILVGYIKIIVELIPKKEPEKTAKHKTKKVECEDIGNEFKMALYNLATYIKDALEPKKKKK